MLILVRSCGPFFCKLSDIEFPFCERVSRRPVFCFDPSTNRQSNYATSRKWLEGELRLRATRKCETGHVGGGGGGEAEGGGRRAEGSPMRLGLRGQSEAATPAFGWKRVLARSFDPVSSKAPSPLRSAGAIQGALDSLRLFPTS